MSMSIRSMFILETPYEEEKEQFYEFMETNCKECIPSHYSENFTVPYLLVRSVVKETKLGERGGKHRQVWKDFNTILKYHQPNSKNNNLHKSQLINMIFDESGGSYQRLMNRIELFIEDFNISDWQFNKVKYGYEHYFLKKGEYGFARDKR